MSNGDVVFGGSVAKLYASHLVPLIFEPYAKDLARRVAAVSPARVLEIAAGTGVVTRELAARLPASTTIVATDLNPAMLDEARAAGTSRPVEWRHADAMQLPFPDASFDAIACQFGVMFFPDKAKAFGEMARVLAPGGTLVFNVWDRIDRNEFAEVVTTALGSVFPSESPRFMARIPHGYHTNAEITKDLAAGGFTHMPSFDVMGERSRGASAREVAIAYCQGTPVRNEIDARDPAKVSTATDAAERALAQRFGDGAIEGRIQAIVITVTR
ncbi:MAG: methyltransferase domain-containing protein [Gemmatimonadaceae bacterium]